LTNNPSLSRALGKLGLAAIAINGLIGAGIFALPAAAANQLDFFSPWMFVICGLVMLPIVASFALLSKYFNQTGGPVVYANQAFGPFIGFQTGWLLYVGRMSALAANGHALILYLSLFIPVLGESGIKPVAVCTLIALLAFLNVIGIKTAAKSMLLVTLLKLLPIVLFVLFGLTYLNADMLFTAQPPQLEQFPASMLLLVYAYIGFEGALVPAGEAKQPKKDMPSALLMTLFAAIVLYFFIQWIVVSTLPLPIETRTPLADSASVIGQAFNFEFGAQVMLIAAVISIFGNLLALMLAAPRMTFALSEQQQLPQWFAKIDPRYTTPTHSIYFLSLAAMVLALTGGFVWLAIFSSLSRLLGYLICVLSLPKIAFSQSQTPAKWLVWSLVITASSACMWLMSQASMKSWMFTAGFIALGSAFYFWSNRKLHTLDSQG